jgi:UDP-glucose 6-dehydrogenase
MQSAKTQDIGLVSRSPRELAWRRFRANKIAIPSDGNCDTSIVNDVVNQLNLQKYVGVVAIKSTVIPGTTDILLDKYPDLKICHVPEFLRQKSALGDFFDNHDVLIIGTHNLEIANKVVQAHRFIPKSVSIVKPVEAEITKYFNNVHNNIYENSIISKHHLIQ